MADPSEEVAEAGEAGILPYADDEAQEIALHRKLRKDEVKAAKRQRREQAVAEKEKAYDNSASMRWLNIGQGARVVRENRSLGLGADDGLGGAT